MATTPRKSGTARTKRPRRKLSSNARTPAARASTATVAVDGTEPLRDVLNADIRVRISGSVLASAVLVVVLVVLTAAAGASWLFAIPTIALAFGAGWLAARSVRSQSGT